MKKLLVIGSVLMVFVLALSTGASCKKADTGTQTTTTTTSTTTTTTSQQTTAATTTTATSVAADNPLLIKHSLGGRANCLSCHAPGAAAAVVFHSPTVPTSHSAFTNDNCLQSGCHVTK